MKERKIKETILSCTKEMRNGNYDKYLENLHEVWKYFHKNRTIKPVKKVQEKKKEVVTKPKFSSLDDLTKINGIGKKTVSDIKKQANNLNELINLIKEHKLALRDDIETKLSKELL